LYYQIVNEYCKGVQLLGYFFHLCYRKRFMNKFYFLLIAVIITLSASANIDSVKVPIGRQIFHEKIATEQKLLDKLDGKQDGIIKAIEQEDINLMITDAFFRRINELKDSVELNKKLIGQLEKVRYLNYLQQVVKAFRIDYKQKLIPASYGPMLIDNFTIIMFATIDSASMVKYIKDAPYEVAKINTEIFTENKGYKESRNLVFLKQSTLFPDKILQNIEPFVNEPFADSMLAISCKVTPTGIYNYAQAPNSPIGRLIHNSTNPLVKRVSELSKTPNALFYFPFLDDILSGKKSIDSLKKIIGNGEVGYDSVAYFKQLVLTEISYTKRLQNADTPIAMFGSNGLRDVLKRKALTHFVNRINELHEKSELVRMKSVEPLSSIDLYYMMVMGEEDIYTSSYKHSFTRLLQRLGKTPTDSLLQKVNYDYFKRFIKMAANFNRLDTFLRLMPIPKSEQIMHSFVDNLDKTNDLEDAVDVADSYSSINDKKLQKTILQYVKENEDAAIATDNGKAKIIYNLLKTIFLSADSTLKPPVNLTTEFGIPSIYNIDIKDLADDTGRVVEQVFFYGDDDGKKFFPPFLASFSDTKLWQQIPKKEWVEIKSIKGQKVSIFVNRPLDSDKNLDDSAQYHLNSYLANAGIVPSVVVHRGHSYWLERTLKRMPDNVKVIVLGSCGGYKNLNQILKSSPNAHIISTKEIGVGDINRPILNYLNQTFTTAKTLDWRTMWTSLSKSFAKETKNIKESWENYIPPYKNLGAIFIKAYNKKVEQ
jgi:hypothetical protein